MPTADTQPDEAGAQPLVPEGTPKPRRAFSKVSRELSDEELSSPGAQKLLLERLAEAEDEISTLKSFQDKYHEADKSNVALKVKLTVSVSQEVISMGCLAVGAAAIGYSQSLWASKDSPSAGPFCLGFGIVLILVAIGAKVIVAIGATEIRK